MRRMWLWGLVLVLAASCQRNEKVVLHRVDVSADPGLLRVIGLSRDSLKQSVLGAIHERPGYVVSDGKQKKEGQSQLSFTIDDLLIDGESQKPTARVLVTVELRPEGPERNRYAVSKQGQASVVTKDEVGAAAAAKSALLQAMGEALDAGRWMIVARGASTRTLKKQLASSDRHARDAALRILADRKDPAAAEPLLEQLQSKDLEAVRQAMGGLVQLKEARAAPILIDLAKEKEGLLVTEILFALAAIGGDEAEAYLFTVAQGHDQPAVQAAAQRALEEVQGAKEKNR